MDLNALLGTFANNLLPILLLGAVGYVLGKALPVDSRSLGRVVFYIFSPILVFNLILQTSLAAGEVFATVGFSIAIAALTGLLAWILGWSMRLPRPMLVAIIMTAALANTGNYGLPVVAFAFGKDALAFASVYFVTNSILFNTVGVLLASLGHMDLKSAALGVFKVPAVYGVVLAALIDTFGITLPSPIARTIDLAANGAIPVMIVLLGLELSRVVWSHSVRPIALSVGVRLVAAPLIGLLLAIPLGFQGAARQGAITETAMPAAVTNIVLATEYGLDSSLVTAMVFVGTILSPLTITPLLVYLTR